MGIGSALILLTVAILLILVYYYGIRPRRQKNTDTPPQPAEADPIQDLVALNLEIRKSVLPRHLTHRCESVIDKLVELIPQVNAADEPTGDLAWTVNRMASEYLPNKCIRPYLALKPEDRESPEQIQQFEQSLTVLSNELDEVAAILSRRDKAEFATKAKFLQHRFTNNGEA